MYVEIFNSMGVKLAQVRREFEKPKAFGWEGFRPSNATLVKKRVSAGLYERDYPSAVSKKNTSY